MSTSPAISRRRSRSSRAIKDFREDLCAFSAAPITADARFALLQRCRLCAMGARLAPFLLFLLAALGCACSPALVPEPTDAAPDAAADAVDTLPAPLPITEDEHVAACARLSACMPESARELSVCASSYVYFVGDSQFAELALLVRCVNSAGSDCTRVRACTNLGVSPEPCDPVTTVPRCDGEVARSCHARTGLTYGVDCAAIGQHCAIDRLGRALCGLGSCPIGSPDYCEGNRLVQCIDAVLTFADCERAGMRCVSTGSIPSEDAGTGASPARCAGRGDPCNPATFGQGCFGGLLRACLGGYAAQIDCAVVVPAYRCVEDESGAPRCARSATPECMADPVKGTTFAEHCEGSALVYCRDGIVSRLDCISLGFARCEASARPPRCAH